jgi:cytidylate kinase
MKHITVAVDGPAGSGKSTVARDVASRFGLLYLDSGALYRAITWYVYVNWDILEKAPEVETILPEIELRQVYGDDNSCRTYVNGRDVSGEIRNEEITRRIGEVSDSRPVRDFVNSQLRSWSGEESIIMDGRDIGTVVFPDADLKVYLDASVEERTRRRLNEYREKGKNLDENLIRNQIIRRDEQDRSRPYGALKKADDAIYIDSSHLSREEVIDRISTYIHRFR